MSNFIRGSFIGTTLLQSSRVIGGAKSVFVKLGGDKDDLIFPTHGGVLKNPFKGAAKIYAGDLFEYLPDANGQKPELTLLKTYLVKSQAGTKVVIYKDGYKHVPFVGDVLMKAPATIGGTGKAYAVTAVSVNADGNWELTFGTAIDSVSDGDILVEAKEAGASKAMLVSHINAVAPCDYDCLYEPASGDSDWEGARYMLAPALRATMYLKRMSPVPACVKALNKCDVNGWFRVDALQAPFGSYAESGSGSGSGQGSA